MRYELMRLLQLVFSLSLMFGAFAAGLAAGWYRWGRTGTPAGDEVASHSGPTLFSADPGFAAAAAEAPAGPPVAVPVPPRPVLVAPEVDLREAPRPHATFAPGALPAPFAPAAAPVHEEHVR
ncbi:MAG: hypothetical protein ACOYOP_05770 [Microthrixaceae bacterium]